MYVYMYVFLVFQRWDITILPWLAQNSQSSCLRSLVLRYSFHRKTKLNCHLQTRWLQQILEKGNLVSSKCLKFLFKQSGNTKLERIPIYSWEVFMITFKHKELLGLLQFMLRIRPGPEPCILPETPWIAPIVPSREVVQQRWNSFNHGSSSKPESRGLLVVPRQT